MPESPHRRRRAPSPLGVGALVIGLGLAWAASERLVAAAHLLPKDHLAVAMAAGRGLDASTLRDFEANRVGALARRESGRAWRELAAARLRLSHLGDEDGRAAALRGAAAAARAAIRRQPSDPYAWALLSATAFAQGDDPLGWRAFERSLDGGRLDPGLAPWRLRVLLSRARLGSPGLDEARRAQVRYMDRRDPARLWTIARSVAAVPTVASILRNADQPR